MAEQEEASTIGYAAAMSELDDILRTLDDDDLDIDRLADLVARAAELIAVCRDRLDAARFRVTEIVADLETD